MVRTLPFPGRGIKILHAMQCGGKKKNTQAKHSGANYIRGDNLSVGPKVGHGGILRGRN